MLMVWSGRRLSWIAAISEFCRLFKKLEFSCLLQCAEPANNKDDLERVIAVKNHKILFQTEVALKIEQDGFSSIPIVAMRIL